MTKEERREIYALMKAIIATQYNVAYDGDGWVRYLAPRWPDGYCTFHAFEFSGTELEAYRRAEKDLGLRGNPDYREAYSSAWEYATKKLGLDKEETSESPTTIARNAPGNPPAGDYCAAWDV